MFFSLDNTVDFKIGFSEFKMSDFMFFTKNIKKEILIDFVAIR